jgi:hypothetical protein
MSVIDENGSATGSESMGLVAVLGIGEDVDSAVVMAGKALCEGNMTALSTVALGGKS